jgi:hypothetical protein
VDGDRRRRDPRLGVDRRRFRIDRRALSTFLGKRMRAAATRAIRSSNGAIHVRIRR